MSTQLLRSLNALPAKAQGAIATIGNFDGVHLGHQALIRAVLATAKEQGAPSLVITFEPHPAEFFAGSQLTVPRLTRFREKFLALAALQPDYVLFLPFNQKLANLTASEFVSQILVDALRIKQVIIGDDFRFGQKRQGDFTLLKQLGAAAEFGVQAMDTLEVAGARVSSTRIREALKVADLALAQTLLGRPYTMQGRVRPGEKLGRQWGFPTANLFLHRRLTPVLGVFTVFMHGLAAKPLPGVANIGTRPTVNGTKTLLEVHLLDFNRDIYNHDVKVEFCHKLRDEVHYPNVELLKAQIAEDVRIARQYFEMN